MSKWRTRRCTWLPSKFMIKIYFLVFTNMFSSSFSITILFPFLPFMMEFLIPELREDKAAVGIYAGVVGGSIFVGRIFGSYFWGILADKKGRRPIMIISGGLAAITSLSFGFSVNFTMAVMTRFLMGLVNGMISTSKAIVSEVSDDSNQAMGITMIGTAWGAGLLIGPALSGVIADPIGQYNLNITNSFLHGYLTRFPYSPPCIASFLLFVFSTFLTIFFLPETLGSKKNRKRSELEPNAIALVHIQSNNDKSPGASPENADICENEETELLTPDDAPNTENMVISNPVTTMLINSDNANLQVDSSTDRAISPRGESRGEENSTVGGENSADGGLRVEVKEEEDLEEEEEELNEVPSYSTKHRYLTKIKAVLRTSLLDLKLYFCHRATLIVILLYSVYSFAVIGSNEIYSLWAYTPPHLGGLGFSLREIGISLTIIGVMNFFISLVGFAVLEKYIGAINTFYVISISLVFLIPIQPNLNYLLSVNTWLLWFFLILLAFFINGCATIGFSCIFMFINNSVTFDKLGSINGVSVMMTSIARCIAPIAAGSIFSLSLSDATLSFGFPVDYHLVFIMFSVVYLLTVLMVACLPKSINHQKIIENVD